MVLVDTSLWVDALRERGTAEGKQRVGKLLASAEAAWCNVVRLELWNGVRGAREKEALRQLDAEIPNLPITEPVWDLAIELAQIARSAGLTVPADDLLIAACARFHAVPLEHNDDHLGRLMKIIVES